jgi:hypothetical protein
MVTVCYHDLSHKYNIEHIIKLLILTLPDSNSSSLNYYHSLVPLSYVLMHNWECIQFLFEFIAQRKETTIIRKSQTSVFRLLPSSLSVCFCLRQSTAFCVFRLLPFAAKKKNPAFFMFCLRQINGAFCFPFAILNKSKINFQ